MAGYLPKVAEYKLTDLLSSAGATIGVIIAGTIFLQFLSTKFTELGGRYRELTREYRGVESEHGRHQPLRSQIRNYRHRLVLLNRASCLAAIALLCFLVSVLAGGLSMAFPPIRAYKAVGTTGLASGLVLMAIAVGFELSESILARKEILDEISDLDDEAKQSVF